MALSFGYRRLGSNWSHKILGYPWIFWYVVCEMHHGSRLPIMLMQVLQPHCRPLNRVSCSILPCMLAPVADLWWSPK